MSDLSIIAVFGLPMLALLVSTLIMDYRRRKASATWWKKHEEEKAAFNAKLIERGIEPIP